MVNLDIDIDLLTKYAHLLTQNVNNTDSSEETQESENSQETQGSSSTKFYQKSGYNAKNLVEDLDLKDPKNKYAIIKLMKESDLMSLLPLLDKKSLLAGMKFFTKEKLSTLLSYVPEKELAQVMQQMYSPKEMMELMPVQVVRKFLTNDKIDKQNICKYMDKKMQPQELQEMYQQATGQDIGTTNKDEMIQKICTLNPKVFDDAMMAMNPKSAKGMATFVLEQQPDMIEKFSSLQMSMCLDKSSKGEIIEGMEALENDTLCKVMENLPPQLIQQVVTQIDPEVFADKLLKDMPDVLDKLC